MKTRAPYVAVACVLVLAALFLAAGCGTKAKPSKTTVPVTTAPKTTLPKADGSMPQSGTAPQPSGVTTPSGATAPQAGQSQQQVIKDYYATHENSNLQTPAGPAKLARFTASKSDPSWELWYIPWGQGEDIDTVLMHQVNGVWNVVAISHDSLEALPKLNPQSYGAPDDLTWQGWPPA